MVFELYQRKADLSGWDRLTGYGPVATNPLTPPPAITTVQTDSRTPDPGWFYFTDQGSFEVAHKVRGVFKDLVLVYQEKGMDDILGIKCYNSDHAAQKTLLDGTAILAAGRKGIQDVE
jgi:hypothetical protein